MEAKVKEARELERRKEQERLRQEELAQKELELIKQREEAQRKEQENLRKVAEAKQREEECLAAIQARRKIIQADFREKVFSTTDHEPYVPATYNGSQKQIILEYSSMGSPLEAILCWRAEHPSVITGSYWIDRRDILFGAAELEMDLNPWLRDEPISRDETEALDAGKKIVEKYDDGKISRDAVLKSLRYKRISVNSTWEDGGKKRCLLVSAINKLDMEMIDYLLEHNCDIGNEAYNTAYGNKIWSSALSAAIIDKQRIGIFDKLIAKGADKKVDIMGFKMNMLSSAAGSCLSSIIKHLLRCGMVPNEESDYTFKTIPLYEALFNVKYPS